MYVFIASPFFNQRQVDTVEGIEQVLAKKGHTFFSARLEKKKGEPEEIKTIEQARNAFQADIDGLLKADCMIANIDWVSPVGTKTLFRSERQNGRTKLIEEIELNTPDSGTCVEIGFMLARQREEWFTGPRPDSPPIFLFTKRPSHATVNIMLTQAAQGVFFGFTDLNKWLTTGKCPSTEWKGGHQ